MNALYSVAQMKLGISNAELMEPDLELYTELFRDPDIGKLYADMHSEHRNSMMQLIEKEVEKM